MKTSGEIKAVFDRYGGMMRTKDLHQESIYYRPLQKLIQEGLVEKIRYGYYQWIDPEDFSEVGTIMRLFPDAIFCMGTALRYYRYSDRIPFHWHLAVSKHSGKSRFKIRYPFVKPFYVEPSLLKLGLSTGDIDGHEVPIYDKERIICDCLRYRKKMDREIFNKAIINYVSDSNISIRNLIDYSERLHVKKVAMDIISIWL